MRRLTFRPPLPPPTPLPLHLPPCLNLRFPGILSLSRGPHSLRPVALLETSYVVVLAVLSLFIVVVVVYAVSSSSSSPSLRSLCRSCCCCRCRRRRCRRWRFRRCTYVRYLLIRRSSAAKNFLRRINCSFPLFFFCPVLSAPRRRPVKPLLPFSPRLKTFAIDERPPS